MEKSQLSKSTFSQSQRWSTIKVNDGQQSAMMMSADVAGDISRCMDNDVAMMTLTRANMAVMTSTGTDVGV